METRMIDVDDVLQGCKAAQNCKRDGKAESLRLAGSWRVCKPQTWCEPRLNAAPSHEYCVYVVASGIELLSVH